MAKQPSPEKAKEILKDGSVQGKPLTEKQKGFFGARAGGQSRREDATKAARGPQEARPVNPHEERSLHEVLYGPNEPFPTRPLAVCYETPAGAVRAYGYQIVVSHHSGNDGHC